VCLLVSIDPARLARSQENMELSRRRLQEAVNARAAEHTEKMNEVSVKPIFPPGEFVRANSKKVGTDPTFSRRIFSLTNHIAKICFSFRANKFA
jgi:hypothetical protein